MTTTPLQFRFATETDIPEIQTLATAAWEQAYADILSPEQMAFDLEREYSEPALKRQISVLNHTFILLEDSDKGALLGFASVSPDPADDESLILNKIYLLPELKGKGYGRILMDTIVNYARHRPFKSISLLVNRYNPAVTFYKRQGFDIIEEQDTCIGESFWRNDYLMRKSLPAIMPLQSTPEIL